MFSSTVQPPVVSLFSSVGSHPLQLFSISVDAALPDDSVVHLLNDQTSLPPPSSNVQLVQLPPDSVESKSRQCSLACTVLHIQSPTIRTTFIRCPPLSTGANNTLGLTHPWFHIQFRDLGREFSFEIGISDTAKRTGVLRCSTFQVCRWYLAIRFLSLDTTGTNTILKEHSSVENSIPPLLHVPLDISPPGCIGPWCTIALNLPTVISHFSSAPCLEGGQRPPSVPSGSYACIHYFKVYANCRLRRVWLARSADSLTNQAWEFGLYTG